MVTAYRYDFNPITGFEETDDGFLRVWCKAARTGIQTYTRADGSKRREYRPPSEVANPESLATFGMAPVTWHHPPTEVNSKNVGQYGKGHSGTHVKFVDGFVEVALNVTHSDAVDGVKRRDATQVSAGYRVDYDPTPGVVPDGEPDAGQPYDGVQRNIRVNHIAIVPRGRAGPEVRLLLDSIDSEDAIDIPPDAKPAAKFTNTPSRTMALVKLDSVDVELPAESAGLVMSYVRDTTSRLDTLEKDNTTLAEQLELAQQEIQSLAGEKEAAEGRADEFEAQLAELEENGETRIDVAELDSLIEQRLDTLQTLAPAFPDDYVFNGKSEAELYREAFTNLTGKELKADADMAFVEGFVNGTLATLNTDSDEEEDDEEEDSEEEEDDEEMVEDRADSRFLRQAVRNRAGRSDSASGYKPAIRQDGWKQPLTAHRV
jgi:hypothetical protein